MFSFNSIMRTHWICCYAGLLFVSTLTMAKPQKTDQKPVVSVQQTFIRQLQTAELEIAESARAVVLPMVSQPLQSAKLYSRISGYIKARYVDIGDQVKNNDLLATIDDPQIKAQEKKILADIDEAKAELDLDHLNYQRGLQLVADNLISESERDRLRIVETQAKARIDSLRAELEGNRSRQSFLEIRAPFDGYIVARGLEVGDLVNADNSQGARFFFEIANTARLRLNIHVPQNEIRYIAPGDEITANFTGYQNLTVKGRISRLSQALDSQSGTMLVEAEIDNREYNLPAGLRGTVSVKTSSGIYENRVFKAPLSAISYHNGHDAVVGLTNAELEFHKVDIVSTSQNGVLLRGDLNSVDKVVLNPNALLMKGG